ncbi:MAG: hypothetical protein ABIL11_16170 [Chloroflexota bacterium]
MIVKKLMAAAFSVGFSLQYHPPQGTAFPHTVLRSVQGRTRDRQRHKPRLSKILERGQAI